MAPKAWRAVPMAALLLLAVLALVPSSRTMQRPRAHVGVTRPPLTMTGPFMYGQRPVAVLAVHSARAVKRVVPTAVPTAPVARRAAPVRIDCHDIGRTRVI
jgi:hypothetical protein